MIDLIHQGKNRNRHARRIHSNLKHLSSSLLFQAGLSGLFSPLRRANTTSRLYSRRLFQNSRNRLLFRRRQQQQQQQGATGDAAAAAAAVDDDMAMMEAIALPDPQTLLLDENVRATIAPL